MACEESGLHYRWQLLEQIALGIMPEGVTAADLRALDLPLPGEVEVAVLPDGRREIRTIVSPSPPSQFVCDVPAADD